jgi:carboxyl-terminal processing protease
VSKNAHNGDKPYETLKYLAADPPKKVAKNPLRDDDKKDDEPGQDDPDGEPEEELATEETFTEDYEIQFARDLVAQAKGWKRREVLASSKPYFDKRMAEEQARLSETLRKITVDWSPVGQGPTPALAATITADKANGEVAAGGTITFKASVTNNGPGVAGQVRAQLKGDDPLFEGREFVFGRIKPGETRSFSVPVKVPKDALTRVDPLRLEVFEEHGAKTALPAEGLTVKLSGMSRPVFAYSYQVIDDVKGNGDGMVQRGESARMRVTVKNVGPGKSNETLAQLRSLSDEGLDIVKGRFNVDNLAPGEQKNVDFTFDLKNDYRPDSFKVELSVYDAILHEYITDKLTFPVAVGSGTVESAQGAVITTADKIDILSSAQTGSPIVASAQKGASFKLTGSAGDFFRVEVEAGRPGYLAKTAAQKQAAGGTPPDSPSFTPQWQVSPPRLEVKHGALLTDSGTYKLSGTVKDERKVADVFVFVSNRQAKIDRRKVFYRSNRKGQTPMQMSFDAEIPLWPGANFVTVVARENNQVQTQETLVVQRPGPIAPAGAVAQQPGNDPLKQLPAR